VAGVDGTGGVGGMGGMGGAATGQDAQDGSITGGAGESDALTIGNTVLMGQVVTSDQAVTRSTSDGTAGIRTGRASATGNLADDSVSQAGMADLAGGLLLGAQSGTTANFGGAFASTGANGATGNASTSNSLLTQTTVRTTPDVTETLVGSGNVAQAILTNDGAPVVAQPGMDGGPGQPGVGATGADGSPGPAGADAPAPAPTPPAAVTIPDLPPVDVTVPVLTVLPPVLLSNSASSSNSSDGIALI
jgi:hypothetical protein